MRILYVCADRGVPLRGAKWASVGGHRGGGLGESSASNASDRDVAARAPCANRPVDRADRDREDGLRHRAEQPAVKRCARSGKRTRSSALTRGRRTTGARGRALPRSRRCRHRAERGRQVFESADAIQVISTQLELYVRSIAPDAEVHVVPNGVDYRLFASTDPAPLPEAHHREAHHRVAIRFLGSMKAWHGVTDLLEAFALVAQRRTQPLLLLVGSGPEEEAARQRASAPDLAGRVLVVGAIPHADVPALVRRLDVAVAPYTRDGDFYFCPLKILEHLAASRPVLSPELGDLPTLVGDAGLVYPPGDVVTLDDRLQRLIDEPELRQRLGAAADERAQGHDWERVAEEVVSLALGYAFP